MDKRIFTLLVAVAALLLLPGTLPGTFALGASACKLRFAWADLPPYQSATADGRPTGIDVELIAEAARRMPCALEWEMVPRMRAIILVQEGKVDALAGVARTAEREQFGIFSQSFRRGRNVLIVRKGTSARYPFRSLTELAEHSFRVGVTSGTKYSQEYEDLNQRGALVDNLIPIQSGDSALAMLTRERIDGFLDGYRVAMYRAEQLGVTALIEVHPMRISEHEAYVVFSRAANIDPAIITRFNAVILGMQADGTVTRMVGDSGS